MAKERLNRQEVIHWVKGMVDGSRRFSDGELEGVAEEIGLTRTRQMIVSEEREVLGERAMLFDIVTLIGSDRGLWDESGYRHGDQLREVDTEFSAQCVELVHNLFSSEHPLLISLILQLKHGIRKIDDGSLWEIYRVLSLPWNQDIEEGSVFEWRLVTLNLAVAAVLADRGYEVQLDYV